VLGFEPCDEIDPLAFGSSNQASNIRDRLWSDPSIHLTSNKQGSDRLLHRFFKIQRQKIEKFRILGWNFLNSVVSDPTGPTLAAKKWPNPGQQFCHRPNGSFAYCKRSPIPVRHLCKFANLGSSLTMNYELFELRTPNLRVLEFVSPFQMHRVRKGEKWGGNVPRRVWKRKNEHALGGWLGKVRLGYVRKGKNAFRKCFYKNLVLPVLGKTHIPFNL